MTLSLVFLDVELSHVEGCIVSKTHFKPSADNFILQAAINSSGLRKNCSLDCDYIAKGKILIDKFIDNGYDYDLVYKAFMECHVSHH